MARSPGERWNCEACGKQLVGGKTMGGATAPVEVQSNAKGNVLLQRHGEMLVAITMGGQLLELAREAGVELRMNHFASCAHAERFRSNEKGDD